jgi:23S rRNA (cytosine1962-C5)-methyltransferase
VAENQFIVGPDTVRMLELGHPWVIADRFTKSWPQDKAGRLINLTDQAEIFLATALYSPGERIVARILSREQMQLNKDWLRRRLQQATDLRLKHLDLCGTTAYRLINSEGDGLPGLTVDRYGDYLMIQCYTEAWSPHLKLITSVLQELFTPCGIYEKFRPQETRKLAAKSDSTRYSRLLVGEKKKGKLTIEENGLNFLVDLEDGLNTGLFLDQRENRRDFMPRVKGKTVLNLFSYTGAFSVAAAAAGAQKVTSVDASASYLEWARENFNCNRLNPKRHEFIADDCFATLDRFKRDSHTFDLILFDPPSFSSTRKSTFSTRGGTAGLAASCLNLLVDNGLLICSSNHQKTDFSDYLKELRRGALKAGCSLRVIGLHSQSGDFPYPVTFPEGRYLKYIMAVKTPL